MRRNYFYQLFHFYNKAQIIYNLPNIHFKNFIINTALCIKSIVNIIKKTNLTYNVCKTISSEVMEERSIKKLNIEINSLNAYKDYINSCDDANLNHKKFKKTVYAIIISVSIFAVSCAALIIYKNNFQNYNIHYRSKISQSFKSSETT